MPPLLLSGAWESMGLYVYYEVGESESAFLQRCHYACVNAGVGCLGYADQQGCPRGGRCCHLHTANTEYVFYSPASFLHVKAGGGSGAVGPAALGTIATPFAPATGRTAAVAADGKPEKTPLASVQATQASARAFEVKTLSTTRALIGPNCAATAFLLPGCGPPSASLTAAECDAAGGLLAGCTTSPTPGGDTDTGEVPSAKAGITTLGAACDDKVSVGALVGGILGAVIGTALLTAAVMYLALSKPMSHAGQPTKAAMTKQPSLNFHTEDTSAAAAQVAVEVK